MDWWRDVFFYWKQLLFDGNSFNLLIRCDFEHILKEENNFQFIMETLICFKSHLIYDLQFGISTLLFEDKWIGWFYRVVKILQ